MPSPLFISDAGHLPNQAGLPLPARPGVVVARIGISAIDLSGWRPLRRGWDEPGLDVVPACALFGPRQALVAG